MAIVGLDTEVSFDKELDESINLYKTILKMFNSGIDYEKLKRYIEKHLDELKIHIVNLEIMTGLTDEEIEKRDIYLDKFFAIIDLIKAVEQEFIQE